MNKKLRFLSILSVLLFLACFNFSALAKVPLMGNLTKEVLAYKYWNTNLSYEERAADLISHMTLIEKCSELLSHGMPAIPRLGIAEYWWPGEANHGIANLTLWYKSSIPDPVSTVFPNLLAQGSTWNPQMIRSMASLIGDEARAYYNESKKGLCHWAPTTILLRDPRWGRVNECYSEDPYLVTQMGDAFVDGFQNDSRSKYLKALATIKHTGPSSTENDRYYSSQDVDERDLHEFYNSPFEQIIHNTNVAGLMVAYTALNGAPCSVNKSLMIDTARATWGFSGFIVSDKGAIKNLYNYTKENTTGDGHWDSYHCLTWEQAVADSMKAGLNLELENPTNVWQTYSQNALNRGLITEDDIDKALFNLFVARFKTGEFDPKNTDYSDIKTVAEYVYKDLTHQNAAIKVAEQATVLLENNGILPLKAANMNSLVVVGQFADQVDNGPYSSTQTEKKKTIVTSPYAAIVAKYHEANPNGKVELISLATNADGKFVLTTDQLAKIKAAGAVIVLLNTWSSSPGGTTGNADFGEFTDRTTIDLPRGQAEMTVQIAAQNANTVVYMMTGAQVNVNSFNKKVAALLWCCYNGQGQGPACANLLFGAANPSGRLTMTWYGNESQLGNMYHNYGIRASNSLGGYGKTYMYFSGDVVYPFGYGKSYSAFNYGTISLTKTTNVTGDDTITATVKVRNTSSVDGYEVVQFYVSSPSGFTERPKERLVGFGKVWIPADETKTVSIPIDISMLHFWNETKHCFDFDKGIYTVKVGASSSDIKSTETFNLIKGKTLAVKTVTPIPNRVVINKKGETIATTLNIAMNNDYLYSDVTGTIMKIKGSSGTYSDGPTLRISYSSSNPKVAKVNSGGIVTAVGTGVATIKATVIMNGLVNTGSYPIAINYGD